MFRVPVASSSLSLVSYFPDQALLEVEFHSGEIYQYLNVPLPIYRALMDAESKGRHFNANIRNCFSCQRIHRALSTSDPSD